MLLAIQFMDGLGIAGFAVAGESVRRPETALPHPARQRVAMPIDFRTSINSWISEQFELMRAQPFCFPRCPVGPLGESAVDKRCDMLRIPAVKSLRQRLVEVLFYARPGRIRCDRSNAEALELRTDPLAHPMRNLPARHRPETPELLYTPADLRLRHVVHWSRRAARKFQAAGPR